MAAAPLATAYELAEQLFGELAAASGPAAADGELLSALTMCEGVARRLERLQIGTIADLERRGTFADRGYPSTVRTLTDLLGWEWFDARRRLTVAEHVRPRVGLDATVLSPRLPATAAVFAEGGCSLRQVEVVAKVLGSGAAGRLSPQVWAAAEREITAKAGDYSPADLLSWATAPSTSRGSTPPGGDPRGTGLVEALDQDGPEPDERPPAQINELFLTRNPHGSGGKINGRFDDGAMFDAIATVIDAMSKPHRRRQPFHRATPGRGTGRRLRVRRRPRRRLGLRRRTPARERRGAARGSGEPGPRGVPGLRRRTLARSAADALL